ncbi:nucleoside 2-deoxyribosyltransferase [Ancylobacter dichloromethanicus]|uniref:Nucleoside 2-deoxyribosyltransferase n=1 Tax=Ancylobacter dichloromethanicus TaxID=518825 RepID=A0A9W6J7A5_9HYPH|nr:nucleoside 2-deoxyribosyltransferase [Ancylobacter dichloromethanicus]MBS7554547.1 nucleoside 2-deoxyribosyltransferase [Ancylobacter dichloromethanicus]GLK71677.1 hypothetical protein GCM10017643_17920 [Ancylobacter dichloromethanicus]
MKTPHLYLAGPEVFRPDAAAAGKRLKQIAQRAGAEGVFPLDGEPVHDAEAIKRRCSEMIDAADAVVANITPFRGHHMDPGTAWEIGYAEARGKPVHLWSNDPRPLRDRIPAGVELDADGWRDDDGHLVEDFELAENLMIAADAGPVWETAEKAMRAAVDDIRHRARNTAERRNARRRFAWVVLAMLGGVALAATVLASRGG